MIRWLIVGLLAATPSVARAESDAFELLWGGDAQRRAFLGVQLIEMTPALRQHFGAPKEAGVMVGSVEDDGPAARAGLRVADIVTAIDGHATEDPGELREQVRGHKAGDTVKLDVLRERKAETVRVTLAERDIRELDVFKLARGAFKWNGEDVKRWRKAMERFRALEGDLPRLERGLEERMKALDERMEQLEKRLMRERKSGATKNDGA
jgi:membrane-associated protease RseP (regulator of RpoE activity)